VRAGRAGADPHHAPRVAIGLIPVSSAPARILENAQSTEIALSNKALVEIRRLAEDADVAGAQMFGKHGGAVETVSRLINEETKTFGRDGHVLFCADVTFLV